MSADAVVAPVRFLQPTAISIPCRPQQSRGHEQGGADREVDEPHNLMGEDSTAQDSSGARHDRDKRPRAQG